MKLSGQNIIIIVLVTISIPVGIYAKLYNGPLKLWVNNSFSGIIYELFWCLAIFLFYKKPFKIAISVFIITCLLEIMQLWHPELLEKIRSYFIGRALLGNSFVWTDFVYYFIGCFIAYLIMKWILKKPMNH